MSPEKEKFVQNLFATYNLNNPEEREIFLQEFFKLMSEDIYQFPIKIFQFDEDDAGDFFLYAFEQLKNGKKLTQYEGKSRFYTWFFSVLRNLTIDFIRAKKNPYQKIFFFKQGTEFAKEFSSNSTFENWNSPDKNLYLKFEEALQSLKLEQRVLFKLAYIGFFDINTEELNYLASLKKKPPAEVMQQILALKEEGLKKLNRLREIEDKLTANFQIIHHLEAKLENFFRENPHLPVERELWSEYYIHPQIPDEILEMIQQLHKRQKRQGQLIKEQKKKLYTTKISTKLLSEFLETDPNLLGVQIGRLTEKLSQILWQQKE